MKQPFNDGQLGLTLGGARIDDRARLGRGPLTLLDEERFHTCPLAVDLGRALPFGRKRLVHLLSQPRRRARGLFQFGAQARRRLRGRVLDLATNAIGLRDDAAIGIGRRIGQTSLKPALPFVADGLDAFAVTFLGFGRGFHEVLDLDAAPVPTRRQTVARLRPPHRQVRPGAFPAIPGGLPRPFLPRPRRFSPPPRVWRLLVLL